jgi:hypothetical protein
MVVVLALFVQKTQWLIKAPWNPKEIKAPSDPWPLNAYRRKLGEKQLGFLNHWLRHH